MTWILFGISTLILVIAAVRLSHYGDIIATRTNLGGAFIGTLLMAGATSLPELLTAVSSISQGAPELSVGNFFGSSMFNMALIGFIDITTRQTRLLKRVAVGHSLTAGLAMLLTAMAVLFIQADLDLRIGWMGIDSLVIIGFYFFGTYLIQQNNTGPSNPVETDAAELAALPSLTHALVGFGIATLVLVFSTPLLVSSSIEIAEITGLSTGFVGTALVAVVTSLPEVVTTFAAMRIQAYDLAIGNLFGSNIFNIFALGVSDLFYTQGSLLTDLPGAFGLAGILALILTGLALIGTLTRVERRMAGLLEPDAALLIITYILGMLLLYQRGIGV